MFGKGYPIVGGVSVMAVKWSAYFARADVERAGREAARSAAKRLFSIDILRGLVILIMALDHIRDFFGRTNFSPEDLSQTTPALFLTRWVTHFCAPVFVLLTGTSAFLYGVKHGSRARLSRFLATRGLWLIAVELLIVNTSWQVGWYNFVFVQVIWAIGWSMILLAVLIRMPATWLFFFCLAFLLGHNLLDGFDKQQFGSFSWLWLVLHQQGWIPTGPGRFGVAVVYPLIPWFAVMGLGYLMGPLFLMERNARRRALTYLGLGLIALFILLRALNVYGDPSPWSMQERGFLFTLLSFLNTSKYPSSLLFLLMTLGPAILLLPRLEGGSGPLGRALAVFGSVPFFFYIIHVPIINLSNHIWNYLRYGRFEHFLYKSNALPAEYQPSLPLVYLVWALLCCLLYFFCRWFAVKKKEHRNWWMSYL